MPNPKIYNSNESRLKALEDAVFGGGSSSDFPVAGVLPFAGRNTAVPVGWLLCNGALLQRDDFPELFDVIGTDWGTLGATDFRLPTTQGLLLRGVAYGSGNDPDRASRTAIQTGGATGDQVGTLQTDRYASHQHGTIFTCEGSNATIGNNNSYNLVNGYSRAIKGNSGLNSTANKGMFGSIAGNTNAHGLAGYNGNPGSDAYSKQIRSTNTGSNQTVGQNVGMNFIIKFE